MSLQSLMTDRVDVETQAQTKSGAGAVSMVWVSKATSLPCSFQQRTSGAEVRYGKEGLRETARVYFGSDPNLRIKDRLIFRGEYYEVTNVNDVASKGRIWQCDVERKAVR